MASAGPSDYDLSSNVLQAFSLLQSIPPQRRAHVLLLNMATLANRLFELSGSRDWRSGQSKPVVPPLLQGAVLPPEGAATKNSREVLLLLDHYQTLLFKALAEMSEIQEMEIEKQKIVDATKQKDFAMRTFVNRVRDSLHVLEATVEEFDDYRKTRRTGSQSESVGIGLGSVDVKDLVSYAHRISYTTFAPPEFAEGAPLLGALPPAPQDEQMRASRLYQVNEQDLGLPNKLVEEIGSPVAVAQELPDGKTVGDAPSQALPPGAFPHVPPGWRAGMPLENISLQMLPPIPPGWKPGDPIPFPPDMPPLPPFPPSGATPGDVFVFPPTRLPFMMSNLIGGTSAAAASVSLPPVNVPGVIQVPFVQLDLNPELDDEFGSDFSEDEESSDDEE